MVKEDILMKVKTYLKNLSTKIKPNETESSLAIFFLTYRKRNGLNECALNMVKTCGICDERDHDEKNCPQLQHVRAIVQGEEDTLM